MSPDILGVVIGLFGLFLGLPAALLGIVDLLSLIENKFRHSSAEFRVRSTTIKVLIGETETEVIKLRKIRVYKKQKLLDNFDQVPEVYADLANPDSTRPVNLNGLYSIPGTAEDTAYGIQVRLSDDEVPFRPLRDHSVVIGYMMTEKIDLLWEPSELMARPPIGREQLVMEVHLPPTRSFKRDEHAHVQAKLFTQSPNAPRQAVQNGKITFRIHDFKDGAGPVEWIRAVVNNPPDQASSSVTLAWEWEKKEPHRVLNRLNPLLDISTLRDTS